jgi:dipeptidyl aminopeptidase/acylaminoacyl peptidase
MEFSGQVAPTDWSADGKFVAFTQGRDQDVWILPMEGLRPGAPYAYIDSSALEYDARFSPDGRWIAFVSEQTGNREVFVTSFPQKGDLIRISTGGGTEPVWRRDGKRLYYLAPDYTITEVDVTTAGPFQHSVPKTRFRFWPGIVPAHISKFDVAPDGNRLLVRMVSEGSPKARLNVILNWTGLLKQ